MRVGSTAYYSGLSGRTQILAPSQEDRHVMTMHNAHQRCMQGAGTAVLPVPGAGTAVLQVQVHMLSLFQVLAVNSVAAPFCR